MVERYIYTLVHETWPLHKRLSLEVQTSTVLHIGTKCALLSIFLLQYLAQCPAWREDHLTNGVEEQGYGGGDE